MKKTYHYSESKFCSFPLDKQWRVMSEILEAVELNWNSIELRQALLTSFRMCLSYIQPSDKVPLPFQQIEHAIVTNNLSWQDFLLLYNQIAPNNNYRDHQLNLKRYDGISHKGTSMPVQVVLDNLRSAFNVGSIFRTAECLQLEKLHLCGVTATPTNPKLQKTAMGTHNELCWEQHSDTLTLIKTLQNQNIPCYALETASEAEEIFAFPYQFPCALVIGNEALGIDEKVLEGCDALIRIPVRGWKNSLNVGTAFAICAYDMLRVWQKEIVYDNPQ